MVQIFLEGVIFPPTTPAVGSLPAILDAMTAFVSESIQWIQSYVSAVTGNPLILLFVTASLACIGVGLLKRLMSV